MEMEKAVTAIDTFRGHPVRICSCCEMRSKSLVTRRKRSWLQFRFMEQLKKRFNLGEIRETEHLWFDAELQLLQLHQL